MRDVAEAKTSSEAEAKAYEAKAKATAKNLKVMEQDIYNRIGKLEDGITDVKVELAQTYKDLINHHKMDEVNSKLYKKELATIREATKDKYAGKGRFDKWVGEILTPQTIAIVLAIIAAIVGAKL